MLSKEGGGFASPDQEPFYRVLLAPGGSMSRLQVA